MSINIKELEYEKRRTIIIKKAPEPDVSACRGGGADPHLDSLAGKKIGFTLAEVLITLGIIGVVAALTMPVLLQKYKKLEYVNRLKSTVSIISQGITHYMADEGMTDLENTGSLNWDSNIDDFNKLFHNYFKVVRDCNQKYLTCFADKYAKLSNKSANPFIYIQPYHSCNFIGILANGVSVCADAYVTDEHNQRIYFEVDVNGPKAPNRYAVDYFSFALDRQGRVSDWFYEEQGFYSPDDPTNATGALGKIMSDGWQIKYPIDGSIKESDYDKGPHPRQQSN